MKLSIHEVLAVMREANNPINHGEIASRLSVSRYRVSGVLQYLKRRGAVVCLKESQRGRNPEPGVWALAENRSRA